MLVFLDFNTQKDLIYDPSKYPVKGASQLLLPFSNITDFIRSNKNSLHVAFKKINRYNTLKNPAYPKEPRHCEGGSTGIDKVPETITSNAVLSLSLNKKLHPENLEFFIKTFVSGAGQVEKPYLLIEHPEWNAFGNPKTEEILDLLFKQLKGDVTFVVFGVPGDKTIFNFLKKLHNNRIPGEIILLDDAIKSFDKDRAKELFAKLVDRAGVEISSVTNLLSKGFKGRAPTRKIKAPDDEKAETKPAVDQSPDPKPVETEVPTQEEAPVEPPTSEGTQE